MAEAQVEAVPPTIEEDPKGELIGEALGEEDASAPKKGELRSRPGTRSFPCTPTHPLNRLQPGVCSMHVSNLCT